MRHLRYLPLAWIVGMEGFIMFFPFLMLCIAIHILIRVYGPTGK